MTFAKNLGLASLLSIGVVAGISDCGGTTDGSHFRTTEGATTSGTGGAGGTTVGPTSSATGPSSSTTMITPPGTGGTTGGAGGSGLTPDAACGTTVENTQQIPTDVYVLEDKSG